MMVMKIKKAKWTKKCVIKTNLSLKIVENCLEATQLDNNIKYPEKDDINRDSY